MPELTLASPLFALLPEHEQHDAVSTRAVRLNATVWADLVDEVRGRFPTLAELIFSSSGALGNGFVLVLNNSVVASDQVPERLDQDDRVYLLAQIAGG